MSEDKKEAIKKLCEEKNEEISSKLIDLMNEQIDNLGLELRDKLVLIAMIYESLGQSVFNSLPMDIDRCKELFEKINDRIRRVFDQSNEERKTKLLLLRAIRSINDDNKKKDA